MKTYRAILDKKDNKYHLEIQKYKKKYFWSGHDWHFHMSYSTTDLNTMINEANLNEHLVPDLKNLVISLWDKK
jgi:hypothetical protein